MQPIGQIKHVQIQRFGLKLGPKPQRYDPRPLQIVKALQLTTTGAIGIAEDDTSFIDVHNMQHTQTRNRGGENDLSLNFTSHYKRIHQTYGEHVYEGAAGENILIETAQNYLLEDLGEMLVIQSAQSSDFIYLNRISIATPCLEFSRFVLGDAPDLSGQQIKEALQFLNYGTRGFYARLPDLAKPVLVQAGDMVFLHHSP